jgi:NAD+ synthase (glutamine-hydrolysing)
VKIALAQIDPTVGDFTGNTAKIVEFAARARALGAELAVFPELAVCGYPPADFLEKASFVARAEQALEEIAQAATADGKLAVLVGGVEHVDASEGGKRVANIAALLENGRVTLRQRKRLLPFYDVFDEQRYFEPGRGQRLLERGGATLAVTICEDTWNDKTFWPRRLYTLDPVEELLTQATGELILLNISASPYWREKRKLRQEMLAAIARRHGAWVVMVNQVGGNDGLIFDGTSLAIAPSGMVAARGASFAEDLVLVDTGAEVEATGKADTNEVRAVYEALALGTRDYVRKCGFRQAVVGLSGGIDSALVAAIAVDALGAENVIGVGMPSRFSSQGSVDDARALAANLGIRFELLGIEETFESFTQALEPVFRGTEFGVAEENLQSRIRGGLLMAMANKFNALVLTTGNKSEMSTGYCTLYGDMVGALAVIGDVMKTRVYELAAWVNREREVIPRATMEKAPSAELRPGQLDTDTLPPYDVLDPILEAYVERYEPAGVIAQQQGVAQELVAQVIRLVERSEYKRQQAAPVLKVTAKSFGTGRRFPIAVKVQV